MYQFVNLWLMDGLDGCQGIRKPVVAVDKQEENTPPTLGYMTDPRGAGRSMEGSLCEAGCPPSRCSELGKQIGQITVVLQCHR